MDENTLLAARELLATTKRNLQLVDEQIETLQSGREPLVLDGDVSTEHRAYFISAVDDTDASNGILLGLDSTAGNKGWGNPKTGTIRNQEDAAFVCTNIMVASRNEAGAGGVLEPFFEEEAPQGLFLRLTDRSTGRSLITGMTVVPTDLDRGAVPFSYFSSDRVGLGSNVKNKLFSEFTIPRAGTVKAEVFMFFAGPPRTAHIRRAFVSLVGYKVYGA